MDFADHGYIKVAAASPEVFIGNPVANTAAILASAKALAADGVSIAVFPELCITGYSAEDLFFTDALLRDSTQALVQLVADNPLPLMAVGIPWRLADGRLLNCGAVISGNRLLGLVPKTVHPNYGEFYDLRWFTPGGGVNETIIHDHLGQFPIRTDQLFELAGHRIGIEICEDLWAPESPSTQACLAGAEIILNLSASNELIAKADYRRDLVRMTSAKTICAYVYASAGSLESTKDIVFGGHCMVAENGLILTESRRFELSAHHVVTDLDIARLRHDRSQNISFTHAGRSRPFRINRCTAQAQALPQLQRTYPKHPFVPADEHEFAARAQEILNIQATGLARRMLGAHCDKLVIGVSGGLDSTLAFLVCVDALAKRSLATDNLVALTLPGPGTTAKTKDNAHRLSKAAGVSMQEISINAAVEQHLQDLQHAGEHDIVFENAQARERTQILFNYANKVGGIVVGTGDLSELALGWCTYNADHMASYNVNASVPKTMIAYLVRWYAKHRASDELAAVLEDVLTTPISPELIPPKDGEISQHTESIVGPYELHDFFLYHFLRGGASPSKIFDLSCTSFATAYTNADIKHWLEQFFKRFISQQFKRTTLPPGPKVGSVSLSPRGDWRMPDEASAEQILAEIDKL
jgi:NAD+ synthase (glutamine-hydrolysing)